MIRSSSEAMCMCETVGSMMQHGKNHYLKPEYFSMEMVLRFNLGTSSSTRRIDEILCLRKEAKISRAVSNNLNKSQQLNPMRKVVKINHNSHFHFGIKVQVLKRNADLECEL